MKFYHYSEIGEHNENEDAINVVPHVSDSSLLICALADGQGGQHGGAVAAQNSVVLCINKAQSLTPGDLLNPFTWVEIGEYIDQSVSQNSDAGYTTFIGACTTPQFIAGASCGDSAVALIIDGKLFILSQNQSKNPPVGSGAARLTPFSAVADGAWKLIIVSDGVWKYAGWDSITKSCLSETGETLISKIQTSVINNTKTLVDDFSIILIEN